MTLPASGTIQISQISTELSRSSTANTSLGESAARSLAGVASGIISLSSFYGKSAGGGGGGGSSGVTPSPTPDWTNISGSADGVRRNGNTVTISGITSAITLQVSFSWLNGDATLYYSKNGGAATAIAVGGTVSMSAGNTLQFSASSPDLSPDSTTVSVINQSDSGVVLDTFTVSLT